jgi:hypothetical protein
MTIYNADEVAEILRLVGKFRVQRINRLCRQGVIRAVKPSNKQGWRIHEKSLEDYLLVKGR